MNLDLSYRGGALAQLAEALGPGLDFGPYTLWAVMGPAARGGAIKLWAREGSRGELCRLWVFYPGLGDDRDAEEFRIRSMQELREAIRRVGEAALRGRGSLGIEPQG